MVVRLGLLVLCLVALVFLPPTPAWEVPRLLAAVGVLAGLVLVLLRLGRRPPGAAHGRWIIVDGSNVMHWYDGTPRIGPVRDVIVHLTALGYTPGVMFDANAGHLLAGGYRHDGAFSRMLSLPADRVMVVPKGTPADGYILRAARDLGARIVTNDRFRDWADDYPEVRSPGHLVRGSYRDGTLWLDLGEEAAGAKGEATTAQTVSR